MLRNLLWHTVTIRKRAWTNVGGQRTPTVTDTTASAAVQAKGTDRSILWGLDVTTNVAVIYFDADPGVSVDDEIIDEDGSIWLALGGATDQAGAGLVYAVNCKLRK